MYISTRSEVKYERKVDTNFSIGIIIIHIKVCLRGQYLDARARLSCCLPSPASIKSHQAVHHRVFLLRTEQLMIKIRTLELILGPCGHFVCLEPRTLTQSVPQTNIDLSMCVYVSTIRYIFQKVHSVYKGSTFCYIQIERRV